MNAPPAPEDPDRESGVFLKGSPDTNPPLRIFTRPWFWVILMSSLWSLPLLKSLQGEFPDPVPGFDREPEAFELLDDTGRKIAISDLGQYLLIVQILDLSSPGAADASFEEFRVRRKRLRGLGSMAVHLILVEDADAPELRAFVDSRTARRPHNFFLVDEGGKVRRSLQAAADRPDAKLFLLDRHGRMRGAYGGGLAESDRFAQNSGQLANWAGSDPGIGEPVTE
ncbi:MAG: hypothetical protein ACI8TQ_003342 [Planctomycetota bacterium]|jgi:hypothetical protein